MAIAPITHYPINITHTKVNHALAHDQLVQEGVVLMPLSYAMCKKVVVSMHMSYAMCTGECRHDTCPRTCADRLWGIAQVHHARAHDLLVQCPKVCRHKYTNICTCKEMRQKKQSNQNRKIIYLEILKRRLEAKTNDHGLRVFSCEILPGGVVLMGARLQTLQSFDQKKPYKLWRRSSSLRKIELLEKKIQSNTNRHSITTPPNAHPPNNPTLLTFSAT